MPEIVLLNENKLNTAYLKMVCTNQALGCMLINYFCFSCCLFELLSEVVQFFTLYAISDSSPNSILSEYKNAHAFKLKNCLTPLTD